MQDTVNQRLEKFMNFKDLNPNSMASKLGTNDTSIRNIINGRNKPGYDFIFNLSQTFEDLNLIWFIRGEGEMIKKVKNYINQEILNIAEEPPNDEIGKDMLKQEIAYLKALVKSKDETIEALKSKAQHGNNPEEVSEAI